MNDEEALIFASLANPNERTSRLVLADWLDEHGHAEQAEVIRIRCELSALSADISARAALPPRERNLTERHIEDWVEHCGLPLTWEQVLAVFRQRLAETAAWCGRGNGSLLTLELRPPDIGSRYAEAAFANRTLSERQAVVNWVAARRACLLAEVGTNADSCDWTEGRLLLFHPDATLFDGAAEAECSEFFDAHNVPAWDTWLFMTVDPPRNWDESYGEFLVCWVPPSVRDRVNSGVMVNPEQCIRWASEVDTALTRRLRDAGLLH